MDIRITLIVTAFLQMSHVLCGTATCRDSWKNLTEAEFEKYTCSKCFIQIMMETKPLLMKWPLTPPYWLYNAFNGSQFYIADPMADPSPVCIAGELDDDECERWKQCCFAAKDCCNAMITDDKEDGTCPMTWDGVACWKGAEPGEAISQDCPSYYENPRVSWRSRRYNLPSYEY